MDFISLSNSLSRENTMLHHVFRSEEVQSELRNGSQDENNQHLLIIPQKSRNYEIFEDESDIPIIEKLSLSQSSDEFGASPRCLHADSREPEVYEDRGQAPSCRSSDDGERTGSSPARNNSLNTTNNDEDSGMPEFLLGSSLKRANPIYESESETEEHVEYNRDRFPVKRRKSVLLERRHSLQTPLYWSERLSTE